MAMNFNLLDEQMRMKAIGHLLEAIKKYNNHLSTGIQATNRLMLELSKNGYHDEAWRLINLRSAPSWGYMVDMGATTIWERWDGDVKGRGIQSPNMNSFNHMAFGSVGEWVWRDIIGINLDEEQPGYKHFFIRPRLLPELSWAKGKYESIHGTIESSWKIEASEFFFNVTIPANTTATIFLPAKDVLSIFESNEPVTWAKGVKFNRMEKGNAVFDIASGNYSFVTQIK